MSLINNYLQIKLYVLLYWQLKHMKNIYKIAFLGLVLLCFFSKKASAQTTETFISRTIKIDSVFINFGFSPDLNPNVNPKDLIQSGNDTIWLVLPADYHYMYKNEFIMEVHSPGEDKSTKINSLYKNNNKGRKTLITAGTKIPKLVYLFL